MTTMTITTNTTDQTCVHADAASTLKNDRTLSMLLDVTTERVANLIADEMPGDDIRLAVDFETRKRSGWYITDWRVDAGDVPGDDVTTVSLQVVYRPGKDDLKRAILQVHESLSTATDEHVAQAATAAISAYVQEHASAVEILLDDVFLDVLSEYMGVERDVFDLSFCVEAEFASVIVSERCVLEVLSAEFDAIVKELTDLGVEE